MVAPGSIPKGSGDRVKTDRRDAIRLARLFAAGELSFVFVPSEKDEHFRDLVRAIEDVRKDLMRARHRLWKFLLRRGERYPGPGAVDDKQHDWLRELDFEDACLQATFVDYLASVQVLMGRRTGLIGALEAQIPDCSHAPVIARLRCFRGIDTLTAAGLCAEVGDFHRFPSPRLLSGFLGVVPSERTSDDKRRQGSITKAGPLTPAGCWSRPPTTTATSRRSARGSPPPSRSGPPCHRDRLALPTPPAPALAAPPPRAAQAHGRRRDRVRPRARRVLLGGRDP